jgi:hypothetical protein
VTSKEFEQRLCTAFEAYQGGLRAAWAEMATDSRGGAITALQSVIKFTNAISREDSQSLTLPLTAVLSALNDLNHGRVVPMLEAKKGVDNRKPDAGFRKVQRAATIFCIEKLIEAGEKSEQAARFVSAILEREGVPIGGRSSTPLSKTVRNWRNDASRRHQNDQQTHTLAAFRQDFVIPAGTPLDEVKVMVEKALPAMLKFTATGLG